MLVHKYGAVEIVEKGRVFKTENMVNNMVNNNRHKNVEEKTSFTINLNGEIKVMVSGR